MADEGAAGPYLSFDSDDYSLAPGVVGRRVEVRAGQRDITAVVLDTSELALRRERSFAKPRAITMLKHARILKERRGERQQDVVVERRTLPVYDG